MDVTTRVAGETDLSFLGEIDAHVSAQELAQVVGLGRVLVAEVDGSAAGCLRWGLFWDAVPFMNLLHVVAEHRGRNVGTTLVGAWENSQRAAGHTWVLTSTVSAETSQHFYRRLGYVDAGALLLPDEPTELFLRKALTPAGR